MIRSLPWWGGGDRSGILWELTGDEALEEALAGEVSVVLLEVLLAWGGELHGNELEATVLEARDDGANEATLEG